MGGENLSELIFSDSVGSSLETSSLLPKFVKGSEKTTQNWYRVLNRREWAWRGIQPIEVEYVLSKIAAAQQPRTQERWLDTVMGYRSGNWTYEWNQLAVAAQQRCDAAKLETTARYLSDCLYASLLFSVASYPHLKGDRLAFEAELFSINSYNKAFSIQQGTIKNLKIPYKKNHIQAILHLPAPSNKPCPVLIVCSGLDSLLVDYYRLYENYLAPAGIAMLTMDAPGLGQHEHYPLTEHSSELHEQVIEHLATIPMVDDNKIILLGLKFGTNIATRTAYLYPHKVKGLICVLPIVHEWFTNTKMQDSTPMMYQDIFYNRLDSNTLSKEGFAAELSSFSLKKQGLLPRQFNVPFLGVQIDNPYVYQNLDDLKLLKSSAKQAEIIKVTNFWGSPKSDAALLKIINWINHIFR